MGKLLSLLKSVDRSIRGRMGYWMQAVSKEVDALSAAQAQVRTSGGIHFFDDAGAALTGPFPADTWASLSPVSLTADTLSSDLATTGEVLTYLGQSKLVTISAGVSLFVAGVAVREVVALGIFINRVLVEVSRAAGIASVVVEDTNYAVYVTTEFSHQLLPGDDIDIRLMQTVDGDFTMSLVSAYLVVSSG